MGQGNRHFKPLVIIIIIILIFVVFFIVKIFNMSKNISQFDNSDWLDNQELKASLQASYTPELQKIVEGQDNYWLGTDQPQITIVGFSDFACSHCRSSYTTIRQLGVEYKDKIKIIFRDRPAFDYSMNLAMAAQCAGEQGKFWAMHDKLFQNQSAELGATAQDLGNLAQQVGVEMASFADCYNSKKYLDKIKQNFQDSENLNVAGTPTWFVNGQKIEGNVPLADWQALLNKLID